MEEREQLIKELEMLRHKNRFDAPPAGYFNQLEAEVMQQIRMAEALGREEQASVPDGYFESLESRVMQKIEHRPASGKMMYMHNLRWVSVAAVMVLAVAVMLKFVLPVGVVAEEKNNYAALSQKFGTELSHDDVNHLIQSFNSEEDLWLLQELETVNTGELPEIEGLGEDEQLLQDIMTDEELEYLNEIM